MKGRSAVGLLVAVLIIFSVATARAQQPTFAMLCPNGCSGATPYGNASWGFDSVTTANPGIWWNNGGTFTLVSGGGGGGLTPTFTTVTITGAVDEALNLTNGGHITSLLGTGTKPTVSTCGTGTVANGSTDTAGTVTATGATACTVVFNTAYHAAPICVVVDGTTAGGGIVAQGSATTAHFIVTGLTSGDAFNYICIGK